MQDMDTIIGQYKDTRTYITSLFPDNMTAIEVHRDHWGYSADIAFMDLEGYIDYQTSMGFFEDQLLPLAKALIKAWLSIKWHRFRNR
jgi:hypothetical protein